MILTCNSCEKKFVVPDEAITSSGRIVQCGSCGNKWKQFPIKNELIDTSIDKSRNAKKSFKTIKPKKKNVKKKKEISLYSPEYLKKKHGISITEDKINYHKNNNNNGINKKVKFGFYNFLILFIFMVIVLTRSLYFFQDFIILRFPFTEFYIDYFFETLRNIFEIWVNLITNY